MDSEMKADQTITRTITETGEDYSEVIRQVSLTTINDLFNQITAYFSLRDKKYFKMMTRVYGKLFGDQGNLAMEIFKNSPNHEFPFTQIIIKTYSATAEAEIQALDWLFLNFVCKIN